MKKLFILMFVLLLSVSSVSAYRIIDRFDVSDRVIDGRTSEGGGIWSGNNHQIVDMRLVADTVGFSIVPSNYPGNVYQVNVSFIASFDPGNGDTFCGGTDYPTSNEVCVGVDGSGNILLYIEGSLQTLVGAPNIGSSENTWTIYYDMTANIANVWVGSTRLVKSTGGDFAYSRINNQVFYRVYTAALPSTTYFDHFIIDYVGTTSNTNPIIGYTTPTTNPTGTATMFDNETLSWFAQCSDDGLIAPLNITFSSPDCGALQTTVGPTSATYIIDPQTINPSCIVGGEIDMRVDCYDGELYATQHQLVVTVTSAPIGPVACDTLLSNAPCQIDGLFTLAGDVYIEPDVSGDWITLGIGAEFSGGGHKISFNESTTGPYNVDLFVFQDGSGIDNLDIDIVTGSGDPLNGNIMSIQGDDTFISNMHVEVIEGTVSSFVSVQSVINGAYFENLNFVNYRNTIFDLQPGNSASFTFLNVHSTGNSVQTDMSIYLNGGYILLSNCTWSGAIDSAPFNFAMDVENPLVNVNWDGSFNGINEWPLTFDEIIILGDDWVYVESGTFMDGAAAISWDTSLNSGVSYNVYNNGVLQTAGVGYNIVLADANSLDITVPGFSNWSYAPAGGGCTPDWSCSGYAACDTGDESVCNAVTDANVCGDAYTGDYTEFTPLTCDYCTPAAGNTSWSGWVNMGACLGNDTQLQNSSLTEYDVNTCYGITGLPADLFTETVFYDFQYAPCDFCTPSWSCIGYETCVSPAPNVVCDSVNDTNACSEAYTGNFSEFTVQACSYGGSGGGGGGGWPDDDDQGEDNNSQGAPLLSLTGGSGYEGFVEDAKAFFDDKVKVYWFEILIVGSLVVASMYAYNKKLGKRK